MVTPLAWVLTLAAVAALLLLDVFVSARRATAIRFRQAAGWSAFYIAVALAFGVVLGALAGWDLGVQYFAGYVVEKSLSIDNLFVFVIIMATFAVPAKDQPRALTIGIAVALVLRGIFIALGAALLDAFSFMFLLFGLALLVTAIQLFRHRDEDPAIEDNALVRAARRALPIADRHHGGQIVTRVAGRRVLTPMFLVLIAIGTTDVLFALDSIPAVFGVTRHAYIVFCANAFALLGLRALFFLVSGLLDRLIYLSVGLSLILAFIGVKLVLHFIHLHLEGVPEISTGVSLGVIVLVLLATTVASLVRVRADPTLSAHAGSLRSRPGRTTIGRVSPSEPAPPSQSTVVADHPEADRYEIAVDGERAGLLTYRLNGDAEIVFLHAETDPARSGQGLGSRLVRDALADARARGLAVRPVCPFVQAYVQRHADEYSDLLA